MVAGLSSTLTSLGHEVDVVTSRFGGQPHLETVDGVRVHRVDCRRRKKHSCTMLETASYLSAASPKVLELGSRRDYRINHTHFILPDGLNARRLKLAVDLPYIVTAHGSDVPGYNPHRARIAHRVLAPVWRRITNEASAIVCPSRSLQGLVATRDPRIKTFLIPYGFDSERFRGGDHPREKRILVVTRMLRRKGVQYLLEAVRDWPLDHEIHIVGDGPYLTTLKRLAKDVVPRIVFHGWLDNRAPELTQLYESSEIFVLASEQENFPVALMEAMAAGLAVITSRGTGCSEVVGDAGVLVTPRDPVDLRLALQSLLEDPDRMLELGRAARHRIQNELSWPVIAEKYLALYARFGRAASRIH